MTKTSVFYPARSAPALGHLKSSRNDIEIFVEDSSARNMWVKFIKNILPSGIKFESVNILGSRENVIKACQNDQSNDGRKKLYLVDADLDLLKGKHKPRLKHLYRLRAYCIENYFLQENSLIAIATTYDTMVTEEEAKKTLDFEGWIDRNSAALKSLFVCYAVTHSLADQHQTVGYKVQKLLPPGHNSFDLCPTLTSRRVLRLYRSVREIRSKEEARACFDKISNNAEKLHLLNFVSCKDYILPLILAMMKRSFNANIKSVVFTTMLAERTDASTDQYFSARIRKICFQN